MDASAAGPGAVAREERVAGAPAFAAASIAAGSVVEKSASDRIHGFRAAPLDGAVAGKDAVAGGA